jgi:hypothetical protein
MPGDDVLADRLATLPSYWWSVDPGDVNVGLSMWTGAVCFDSFHTNPNDCVDLLVTEIHRNGLELLVYEAFNLRGNLAMQQQGSEFLTSQMIGAMRHICRRAGVATQSYRPSDHKGIFRNYHFKPPRRPAQEWRSYGHGGHSKDSECLGEYHVRKLLLKGSGY